MERGAAPHARARRRARAGQDPGVAPVDGPPARWFRASRLRADPCAACWSACSRHRPAGPFRGAGRIGRRDRPGGARRPRVRPRRPAQRSLCSAPGQRSWAEQRNLWVKSGRGRPAGPELLAGRERGAARGGDGADADARDPRTWSARSWLEAALSIPGHSGWTGCFTVDAPSGSPVVLELDPILNDVSLTSLAIGLAALPAPAGHAGERLRRRPPLRARLHRRSRSDGELRRPSRSRASGPASMGRSTPISWLVLGHWAHRGRPRCWVVGLLVRGGRDARSAPSAATSCRRSRSAPPWWRRKHRRTGPLRLAGLLGAATRRVLAGERGRGGRWRWAPRRTGSRRRAHPGGAGRAHRLVSRWVRPPPAPTGLAVVAYLVGGQIRPAASPPGRRSSHSGGGCRWCSPSWSPAGAGRHDRRRLLLPGPAPLSWLRRGWPEKR